ncbi:unnamed protein product, partial [Mesorhabditis spiculigera]
MGKDELAPVDPDAYEDDSYDYFYTCADNKHPLIGLLKKYKYHWNGIPIRNRQNEKTDPPIVASMIVFGTTGFLLCLYCFRVIFRNSRLSRGVKWFLTIDCFCRLHESWTLLFKAHCVVTFWCVDVTNPPFHGLFFNQLITALNLGMFYSIQCLGNGLALNRLFAVVLEGRFAAKFERYAPQHALIAWLFPIGVHVYEMGNVVNPDTGYVCFGGWTFNPLEYSDYAWWWWDKSVALMMDHFDKLMYFVFMTTVFFDIVTLVRIRTMHRQSPLKRSVEQRLAIMLLITHLTTIIFLASNVVSNYIFPDETPIFYYLVEDVASFFGHSFYTLIVILSNLSNEKRRIAARIVASRSTGISDKKTALKV